MPNKITYTIKTSDGKEHQVSKENIDKHGIQAYADAYKGATIRMRDSKKGDYDIPLANYNDAKAQGLHAFSWEHLPPKAQPQAKQQVAQKQSTQQVATTAPGTPMTATQKAQVLNNISGIVAQSQEAINETILKNKVALDRTKKPFSNINNITLGRKNSGSIGSDKVKEHTIDGKKVYSDDKGNIYDSENSAVSEVQERMIDRDGLSKRIAELSVENENANKRLNEIREKYQKQLTPTQIYGQNGTAGNFNALDKLLENDDEYMMLLTTTRNNQRSLDILRNKQQENNDKHNGVNVFGRSIKSLGRGMRDYFKTDFDPMGDATGKDALAYMRAEKIVETLSKKLQTGETLSTKEKATLALFNSYNQQQDISGDDNLSSWMYSGGRGVSLSAEFGAMIASGAGSFQTIAEKTAQGASKAALSQITKYLGKGVAKNIGTKIATKAVGSVAGMMSSGLAYTSTVGFKKTFANAMQNYVGEMGVTEDGQIAFGEYVKDKEGKVSFKRKDGGITDLVTAFAKAGYEQTKENGTEMLGETLPSITKILKGIGGTAKFVSKLEKIGATPFVESINKALRMTGYNGLPSQGIEEYAGLLSDVIFSDASLKDFGKLQTHLDIWGNVALTSGVMSSVQVAGIGTGAAMFYKYKHQNDKAGKKAQALIGDKWNGIQEVLDNTVNAEFSGALAGILSREDLNGEQKKRVVNYANSLLKMRGFNIGFNNDKMGRMASSGEKGIDGAISEVSYAAGYNATEDELANIKNELELRHRQLAETFKDDPSALQQIEEDPKAFLQGLKESEVGGEKAKVINAYEETRAAYDGMIQRVKDNIDDAITENNTVIEQRTHQDGNIYPATMKLDDRKVYVVGGNVQMNEDGKGIDHEKSSSSVMVRDAKTGKVEMVDPSAILSVDTPVNAEEEKSTSSEQIKQTYAQEQANKIDGVLEFKAGDTYSILGEDQKQHTIQIIGEAIDEKTKQPNPDMVMASIDGLEPTMLPKEQIQAMNDEENLWRLDQSLKQGEDVENTTPHSAQSYNLNDEITLINEDGKPVRGSITTDQNEDGKFEVYTEEPINGKRVNLLSAEELDAMTGKQQEQQTNQAPMQGEQMGSPALVAENATTQKEDIAGVNDGTIAENATVQKEETPQHQPTALERIPTNEQGEPIYEQADPETAWDAIVEQTEGDESIAQSVADGMVADMEAAVKRAEKAKVKDGTTIAEKIAAEKERVATIEQAKARLEHWKKIASTNSRRQEAIQAEESRKAKEAALLRKEQEEKERDKREEAQPQTLDYKLSDEVDENGHPFVLTSARELAFGNIGKETGLAPAPILLSEGVITNSKTNAGYGLVHIEARHGEQIRNAGYPSVVAFVEEVAKHYDVIREGINRSGEQTYMLQLTDRHNNTLMVELSGDGTYYNINTAGIFKTSYGKNRREVYNRHTTDNQSTESGEESQGEAQSGTTSPSRMKSSTRSSAGKVSESSNAMQGNAEKTSENEATIVETNPTEAQKEAGNYKKGHIKVDGMNITIEQPKGSIRRGKDASGKEWESEMHNTYGYIRGTEGVDGDHIDIFLSDNPNEGNVFVVDQVNKDGSFDEHKVMYGFADKESARQAYLSNYEDGWQGLGNITEVSKEEFKKWIGSSKRKTKPFAEYKGIIKSNKSVSSPVAMSEDEYLTSKGLNGNMTDYMLDKLRIPHSETARQQKQREKEAARVRADFDNQKEEARKEYRQKIAKGELREPTKQEAKEREIAKLIKTANGHEDNPSVQAARRLLAKRGVDWRTDKGDTSDNDWLKSKEDGKSNVVHSFGNSASQNDTSIKLSDTSFAKMKNGEQKAEEEIGWLVDHNIRLKENSRKLDEIAHLLFDGDNIDSNRESALREEAKKILEENEKLSRDYQKNYSDKYFGTDDITANYILQEANERLIALGVKPVKESYYFQNRKNEVAQNAVVHLLKRIGIPVHFISRVGAEASGQGNSRGWTNGLDIWLTKDNINAETPVHEYTHIWTFALMKNNPKLWAEIKNLLKDSEWVDTIQSMDEYKYTLDNEDLLYSEVLSRISGERNGEKFESMAFKLIEEVNSVEKKVDLKRGLEKLRDALKRFWEWVGVNLFGMKEFKSVDDVCDRVLFDLLNASDIARTEEMREYYEEEREMNTIIDKAKEDGTYLKTPNGEDSKLPEKVWAYARTKKFKTQLSDRLNLILNESKEDFKDWEKEEFRDLFKKHGLLEENNEPGRFLVSQFMYSEKYYDRKGKMQEEAKETMNSGKGGENVSSVKSVDMTEEAKTFAKQHNLDASDVIAYKQAMEEGLLRDANNALSAIRRKLREENKGLSLSGFVKKFSPIREALYKQFGDLGVLEKEYHDNILKERGLMEAARKREEEERKRQNEPIEELMSMTSEERDAEYMRALEAKDEKRMFEVLQAEAKLKGYSMGSEYQGEGTWKAPSNPGYSSTEERRAALEKDSPHLNIDDIANGFMNWPEDISTDLHAYGNDNESGKESAKAISDAISDIKDGKGMPEVTVYRAVPTSVEEESLRNGDWVTPSKAYAKIHGESRLDGDYRIIEQKVPANELWWDGNDIREWGFDNGKDYAYKNTENSRKLNDLITRDDQGNVILPSQRFNEKVEDERFRNDEELEEVNQRFNEELNNLTEANADKVTLWLGKPSDVLLSSGIENKPLKLYGNKVIKKMKKHGFALDELRDLPKAVADPIAVFDNYQREGNRTILTELRSQEKNIMVAVTLGKNGVDVDFNIVSSVFGKGSSNVVDWISKGYLAYVDKEKALNYLYFSERNISEAADNSRLSSAANIVKSFENPTNSSEKVLDRKTAQAEEVAEKEHQQMAERANELAETLHLDNVEIVTDASTLEGKKAKAKGFYSTSTGKITIVIPNHSNIADVEKTLLHEAVAHHGLRKLFGEHFDNFLDNVFKNASEDVRREIVKLAAKNKWDFRIATEEYLASLAEDTNFEKMPNGFWDKVKRLFSDMLRSIGLLKQKDGELNDNELRYILWRSYKNLKEKGQSNSILNKAEDIAMQHRLKVGNYAPQEEGKAKVSEKPHKKEKVDNNTTLYREDEPEVTARTIYEDAVKDTGKMSMLSALAHTYSKEGRERFKHKFSESYFDYSRSIKQLQDAISKASGRKLEEFEEVWKSLNAKSSIDSEEINLAMLRYISPLSIHIAEMIRGVKMDGQQLTLDDVEVYMNALHGIERNAYMANSELKSLVDKKLEKWKEHRLKKLRDSGISKEEALSVIATEEVDKRDEITQLNMDKTRKDYSGLTALFSDENTNNIDVTILEERAQKYVNAFEKAVGKDKVDEMWKKVKNLNDFSIRKAYLSGLINKKHYDEIKNMYEHYVPLRGWHDDYAGDIFEYVNAGQSMDALQGVVKKAYGRATRAGNILGTMASMANTAIVQGNKNLVAQKFLNLALNYGNKSGLLMVSKQWYEETASGELVPLYPSLKEGMSAAEMQQRIEEFEAEMEEAKKSGTKKIYTRSFGDNMPQNFQKWQEKQHSIRALRNGVEHTIYVLGNPKAAQAFNGLLTPESQVGAVQDIIMKVMRFQAMMQTSLSPEFVISNFQRDVLTAATGTYIKYGWGAGKDFASNLTKVMPVSGLQEGNPFGIYNLIHKYNKGTLDKTNDIERMFDEFVRKGGMTGISSITRAEEFEKQMEKSVKRIKRGKLDVPQQLWEDLADGIEFMNKGIENATRFAAYMTSRKMGKNVTDSIFDAKECSVNFNMKGSGAWGNLWMRRYILYANPALQSLRMLGTWYEASPKRFMGVFSTVLTASILTAMLGYASGGDDGDDNDWYKLNEFNRYNYISVKAGNGFAHWSLPQEMRPVWALGQIAFDWSNGRVSAPIAINSMATQLNNLSPMAFFSGGSDNDDSFWKTAVKAWTPTVLADFMDAYAWNENFLGKNITYRNDWNKEAPEWRKAGKDTPKWAVNLSRAWNKATGGADNRKSWWDSPALNPSAVYYIMSSQFGGMGTLATKLSRAFEQWQDPEQEVEARNIPFVSKFWVTVGDDYSKNRVLNEEFKSIWNEWKLTDYEIKHNESDLEKGLITDEEYANLEADKKYLANKIRYEALEDLMKDYNTLMRKRNDENDNPLLDEEILELKKEVVKRAKMLDK